MFAKNPFAIAASAVFLTSTALAAQPGTEVQRPEVPIQESGTALHQHEVETRSAQAEMQKPEAELGTSEVRSAKAGEVSEQANGDPSEAANAAAEPVERAERPRDQRPEGLCNPFSVNFRGGGHDDRVTG
jgi:hypothetical protein